MDKKWLKTLRVTNNQEILNSETYAELVGCIEWFEKFINDSKVPNIIGMIHLMIASHLKDVKDPHTTILRGIFNAPNPSLGIGSKIPGNPIVIISANNTPGLEIKCGLNGQKDFSGPTIHIHPVGEARKGWEELRKKGTSLSGYNIPPSIMETILCDFERITSKSRNDILLELAKSNDIVEYHPDGWNHKCLIERLKKDDNPLPGIDHSNVWSLNREGSPVSVFGNANSYVMEETNGKMCLNIRIERTGEKFDMPKRRWFDKLDT